MKKIVHIRLWLSWFGRVFETKLTLITIYTVWWDVVWQIECSKANQLQTIVVDRSKPNKQRISNANDENKKKTNNWILANLSWWVLRERLLFFVGTFPLTNLEIIWEIHADDDLLFFCLAFFCMHKIYTQQKSERHKNSNIVVNQCQEIVNIVWVLVKVNFFSVDFDTFNDARMRIGWTEWFIDQL